MKKQRNQYLTEAREKLGIKLGEFAEAVGINKTVYSSFESLYRLPGKDSQRKIIDYFKDRGIVLDKKAFSESLYGKYEKENRDKNNLLIEARNKLGLGLKAFAKEIGMAPNYYVDIENLKSFPGEVVQKKIINYLVSKNIPLLKEDLFDKSLYNSTQDNVSFVKLNGINEIESENNFYEGVQDVEHRKKTIERVLNTLPSLEKDILKLYFIEEYSLNEIGEKFGLTGERIRQIKEKGIKKIKHSEIRTRTLRDCL